MNINQALSLLGLNESGKTYTAREIKIAFRKAQHKNHPDKNGDKILSQMINAAWELLKDKGDITYIQHADTIDMSARLLKAIDAAIVLDGVIVEVCGSWVWVTGETFKHKDKLNEAGYLYSRSKKAWYFNGSLTKVIAKKRGSMSLDEIRNSHGSEVIKSTDKTMIAA